MTTLVSLLWTLAGAWLLFCLLLSWRSLPMMPAARGVPSRGAPLVSVCIPARNEEKRLGRLLQSLLHQTHPRYEVLVLDDSSTDGTAALVRGYTKRSSRIRLVRGRPLLAGWVGKPWACHQLSLQARGEWLLYMDADVWLEEDAMERTLLAAEKSQADVYSPFPREHAGTWLETLAVPTLVYLLVSFLPMPWVLNPRSPLYRYLGISGQYTIWRRKGYLSFGGHGAVKNEIVEDIKIGWAAARKGLRIAYGNGSDALHCRMYASARDVWEGFSKNIHPFLRGSLLLDGLGLASILLFFVAPFATLFAGNGPLFGPALFLAAAQWTVRLRQALQFKLPLASAVLHPLGCLAFGVIGMNSVYWYKIKGRGHWRGRELRIEKHA